MPSPFPGMDPFIESQHWEGFHHQLISVIAEHLVPQIRPKYYALPQERVYVEWSENGGGRTIQPDVTVAGDESSRVSPARRAGAVATVEPVIVALPAPETIKDSFLSIRSRATDEVVTVIEVLSPTNKRRGADARAEYLAKRHEVLASETNLVEIDLLRGGQRLPVSEDLPPGDYYAFVCRGNRRYEAEVYAWPLQATLPSIPIPLKPEDADVRLDLQAALATSYDRLGFDYSLDYGRDVVPSLPEREESWLRQVVAGQ